ncbi:MAG: PAS domain S-box protein, partial [Oscillochloris sp.]|nr:PAS domain S-box protein [Oscillochloris sp.]
MSSHLRDAGLPTIPLLTEQQIAVLLDLTRAVTEANDLHTLLHGTLQPIATATGWCYGELWLPHERRGTLYSASVWHEDDPVLTDFASTSRQLRFTPGIGVLGRVWMSHRTEWIPDVGGIDPALALRPERVLKAGLRSGFFLPIMVQDTVLALLVFLARDVRPINEPLIRLTNLVAAQIGAAIQRLQAEEALRTREALLRSVTESAVDAIITTDPDGKILTWNPAAEHMFGYSATTALGQPLDMLIPEQYRHIHTRAIEMYQQRRWSKTVGQMIEFNALRNDNTEFPVEMSLSAWTSGRGVCFTSIIRDITERKHNEAELRGLNSELEARVTERTA